MFNEGVLGSVRPTNEHKVNGIELGVGILPGSSVIQFIFFIGAVFLVCD